MRQKAIIIGAGIAGPIMGIQLKKLGYDVDVFEARRNNSADGAFLGITPNGLNVLKTFLSLDKLKEEFTPGSMRFFNSKGKQIADLPTAYQREKYGCETLQVKRAHLNEVIIDAAETLGVKIHYGKKCLQVEENQWQVEAEFEDGYIAHGEILVGCDGAFSTVRRNIFPEKANPSYTKNISTGGFAYLPELNIPLDSIHMSFGEKGFFAYSISNHGEIWWFNNYYREIEPSREEVQTILIDEIKHHLLEMHKNDDPVFSRIIRASHELTAYPVYDIPKLETWYKGRICLLGDAAHATSPHIGQGASLALEDTVVLFKCLREFDFPEIAFKRFQQVRQGRVEKIVKQSRKVGNTKSKTNSVTAWFRDQLMGLFIKRIIKKTDWIYEYEMESNIFSTMSSKNSI